MIDLKKGREIIRANREACTDTQGHYDELEEALDALELMAQRVNLLANDWVGDDHKLAWSDDALSILATREGGS